MTTPLIEAMARAMDRAHIEHCEAHNAALAKAGLWPDHRAKPTTLALCQAALTAITEAGFVVLQQPYQTAMPDTKLRDQLARAHDQLRWARAALDSGYRTTRAKQEIEKIDEYFRAINMGDGK